jgi:hypothetical protein
VSKTFDQGDLVMFHEIIGSVISIMTTIIVVWIVPYVRTIFLA